MNHNLRRGFTLIELVIVITVVGVLAGVFVRYIDEGTRLFLAVDGRKAMVMSGRQAMLRIVREIRQVRSGADVLTAATEEFSFVSVDDTTYVLRRAGDELEFQRGAVRVPIVSGVDSLAFTYYREDGSPAVPQVSPADSDIFRVGIFLRLRDGSEVVPLETQTQLRNL